MDAHPSCDASEDPALPSLSRAATLDISQKFRHILTLLFSIFYQNKKYLGKKEGDGFVLGFSVGVFWHRKTPSSLHYPPLQQ